MGFNVDILSIDGFGKKSLIPGVEERCASAGLPITRVSWQRVLTKATSSGRLGEYPYNELERLWLELFPVFFADASVAGRRLEVPDSFEELAEHNLMGQLRPAKITGMRPASPLATGWLEVAGHTLLHDAVVRPLITEGHVVVQESLGVKNVIKSLFMAEFGAPDQTAALAATRHYVLEYFGRALAPRLGIYLKEDPEAVLAVKGADAIGVFDNFSAFGGDPGQTFLDLQYRCASEFEEFASAHGWVTVDVRDTSSSGREAAADALADAILAAAP
jgi:hypothetical protein